MNSFVNTFERLNNVKSTENGALAYSSTLSKVYDMFAFGGAYRARTPEDVMLLFKEAYNEDPVYALRCLFYLRDCREGQGERRFFRIAYRWLIQNHLAAALRNVDRIPEFGRWDDLIYICEGTHLEAKAFNIIKNQLILDTKCKTPSLLGKWMPSENASSAETARVANKLRTYLRLNHREYRKMLSELRKRINVVERLMSAGRWDEIEFDKIPSRAGFIYRNAFARRDLIAKKYERFIKDNDTSVNAKTLYPYDIVRQARNCHCSFEDTQRVAINKYWENLPDYFEESNNSILAVVDTSGSMTWGSSGVLPIDVAISLGIYAGEHSKGPFKNCYISFASRPQLIKITGVDLCDKVNRIYRTNLCDNTNLSAVFDLLLKMMMSGAAKASDLPKTIVVISDMEIDAGSNWRNKARVETEMENIRRYWAMNGYTLPKLVYWNVNARNNTILDAGPNVSYCSGCSPVLFQQVITGKTGIALMLDKLNSERYAEIH